MSELPMPTRGPVLATGAVHLVKGNGDRGGAEEWCGDVYQVEGNGVKYRGGVCNLQSATCIDGIGPQEAEANSVLIAAAFNAAEEARKMGFDPIAAIQALPKVLDALGTLLKGADSVGGYEWDADEEFYGGRELASIALAAARTRKATP